MINFKKILVHVDAQHPESAVLECAAETAHRHQTDLTLVDITSASSWPLQRMSSRVEHAIEGVVNAKLDALGAIASTLEERGVTVAIDVLRGRSSVAMIREVMQHDHDLLITRAKGRNSRREGFFGTTASHLLQKCPCPVLLVRANQQWKSRQVVAAVAPTSLDAAHDSLDHVVLHHAKAICSAEQSKPDVVSAWDMYLETALKCHMRDGEYEQLRSKLRAEAEHQLDDCLIKHDMGIGSPNVNLMNGDPAEAIIHFMSRLEDALLVMGSVGRGGLAGLLLGNTSELVLNRVQCSVLAVKPAGFVSPIRADIEHAASQAAKGDMAES